MSQQVFPTTPNLAWSVHKIPRFKTIRQESASGKMLRASLTPNPIWQWDLSYEYLSGNELTANSDLGVLMGFFLSRQGMFDSFLFTDPNDNSVVTQNFGTGDGATTQFQLQRSLGTFRERIANINGAPQIFVNGVLKTAGADYTISATGLVTFAIAPGNTFPLTWTGSYYFRVIFDTDDMDFENFAFKFWSLKKLTLVSDLQ